MECTLAVFEQKSLVEVVNWKTSIQFLLSSYCKTCASQQCKLCWRNLIHDANLEHVEKWPPWVEQVEWKKWQTLEPFSQNQGIWHTHTQICTLYLGKLKIFEEIIYTTIFNFHQHLPYISENEDVVFAHQEPLNIGFTLAVGSFETFHLLVTWLVSHALIRIIVVLDCTSTYIYI